MLINLISNAVKFTEEGSITCAARCHDGSIVASITDTGRGIGKVDQEKVFQRFRQVGNMLVDKPAGSGLGLAICKEIVTFHQGKIWVESKEGKGSTFFFTIPLVRVEEVEAESPTPVPDS